MPERGRLIMQNKTLLKTSEVAKYCSVSERTVRGWLQNGQLRGMKVGRQIWRIRPEDLDSFLASSTNKKPAFDYPGLTEIFGA